MVISHLFWCCLTDFLSVVGVKLTFQILLLKTLAQAETTLAELFDTLMLRLEFAHICYFNALF